MAGKTYFLYEKVVWSIYDSMYTDLTVSDPICPKEDCRFTLRQEVLQDPKNKSDYAVFGICTNPKCDGEYQLPYVYAQMQELVKEAYAAAKRQGKPLVALDYKPSALKDRKSNDKYWIETRLREVNGVPTAMVFVGEKGKNDGKKTQIIMDIADSEYRIDAGDLPEGSIIAALKVRFKNKTVETTLD